MSEINIDNTMPDGATADELARKRKELEQERKELEKLRSEIDNERRLLDNERLTFKKSCELEKDRMARENEMLEFKFRKLEAELFSLANEKDKLARDRERLSIERNQMGKSLSLGYDDAGKLFFYGAMDEAEIKARYRSLIKIYHPDNTGSYAGNLAIRIINHEYERLRGIHKSLNSFNR